MEDCIKDWHEVYIEGGYDDPHAEFSARTSQSRGKKNLLSKEEREVQKVNLI